MSDRYGYDRGTPIDRVLIANVLDRHRGRITGRVLEVKDDGYVRRFGREVTHVDVLDVDESNELATIVGDLCDPATLPVDAFDTALVTQTLMYVADPRSAVRHLYRSLTPGGHLLITVATSARIDGSAAQGDRWRLTPTGLEQVVRAECPDGEIVAIESLGNLRLTTAFLAGFAAEELPGSAFGWHDARFPVLAAGVVRKPEPA